MTLAFDQNHAAEALALLCQQYKGKPNLAAILNANSAEVQLVENALNQLQTLRLPISAATGAQLDGIGDLVGRARGGMTDAQFLVWLEAQLLANDSAGQAETLIAIIKIITQGANAIQWYQAYPKSSVISVDGELASSIDPVQLAGILGSAAAAGTNLQLVYSPEDDADSFTFATGDTEQAVADQGWSTVPGVDWANETVGGGFTGLLQSICWGDSLDLWCIVGGSGCIQTSPDGATWTKRTQAGGYSGTFNGVCFGNGLFVAVGASGEIETSPDGITWTKQTQANSYSSAFNAIGWNGTQFVAVGSSAEIQTSSDGVTWTHQTKAGSYSGNFLGAAWGQSQWVIVGGSGEIQTSPDGVTWTHQTSAGGYAGTFNAVAWSGTTWCAVGFSATQIQTSTNGTNWTSRSPAGGFSGFLLGVCWDPASIQFVIVGGSMEIETSPDGTTWTHQTPATASAHNLDAVAADSHMGLVTVSSVQEIEVSGMPGGVLADVQQC